MNKSSKRSWAVARKGRKRAKVTLQSLQKQVSNIRKSTEYKWWDTSQTSYTTGTVTPINLVPLGDDANTRDGRKISIKSILITGYGAAADTKGAPRIMLVYDKQTNGSLPAITDILSENNWSSAHNLNYRNRFKVLYDNVGGIGRNTNPLMVVPSGTASGQFIWHDYLKCDLETIFGEAQTGIQMIKTGGLYFVYIGTGMISIMGEFRTRIRFVDG